MLLAQSLTQRLSALGSYGAITTDQEFVLSHQAIIWGRQAKDIAERLSLSMEQLFNTDVLRGLAPKDRRIIKALNELMKQVAELEGAPPHRNHSASNRPRHLYLVPTAG